jgi:hypothetical protein
VKIASLASRCTRTVAPSLVLTAVSHSSYQITPSLSRMKLLDLHDMGVEEWCSFLFACPSFPNRNQSVYLLLAGRFHQESRWFEWSAQHFYLFLLAGYLDSYWLHIARSIQKSMLLVSRCGSASYCPHNPSFVWRRA